MSTVRRQVRHEKQEKVGQALLPENCHTKVGLGHLLNGAHGAVGSPKRGCLRRLHSWYSFHLLLIFREQCNLSVGVRGEQVCVKKKTFKVDHGWQT